MKYNCPICGVELNEFAGEKSHPGNPAFGVTLDCGNKACSAPEVMGHGDKVKDAYEVIMAKFGRKPVSGNV